MLESVPTIPSAIACDQSVCVAESNITIAELYSSPETPKVTVKKSPSGFGADGTAFNRAFIAALIGMRRSIATAVLHNGQNVTATGVLPSEKFAISCQTSTCNGTMAASADRRNTITGSRGFNHVLACATVSKLTAFVSGNPNASCANPSGGMPFGGGPPEAKRSSGTVLKRVS